MVEILEAADGYALWIFLLILVLIFYSHIVEIIKALKNRVNGGAEFKFSGLTIGKMITKTDDIEGEVKTYGDPDQLKFLFKAQGEGWKKSTKALEIPNGCLIQVTTDRQSADGDWANAEALEFVPNVRLEQTENSFFQVVEK